MIDTTNLSVEARQLHSSSFVLASFTRWDGSATLVAWGSAFSATLR